MVTGGAGYIGSHTVVKLLEADAEVVVFDNFSNSKPEVLNRIEKITGRRPNLVVGDVRDCEMLGGVFAAHKFDAVMHFAGLKAVGESVSDPIKYYDNNVAGGLVLLKQMAKWGIKRLVFSSSATVYGLPDSVPVREDARLGATSPYGQSKLMVEFFLGDLYRSDPAWSIISLRYFNPVGAHESGLIGEDPNGTPNNLMPFIAQVAINKFANLQIFGDDYETPDGTGVRDYIHVDDLAAGHLSALTAMNRPGISAINLGTGNGYSVLEIVKTFEKVNGVSVPFEIVSRRPGDVDQCYADPSLALSALGWQARHGLERMCADAWRWQTTNPMGYV